MNRQEILEALEKKTTIYVDRVKLVEHGSLYVGVFDAVYKGGHYSFLDFTSERKNYTAAEVDQAILENKKIVFSDSEFYTHDQWRMFVMYGDIMFVKRRNTRDVHCHSIRSIREIIQ